MSNYTDLLAIFGIGGAHPGGLELTKTNLLQENLKNKSLLEVGCGTGQTSFFLHSMDVDVTPIDYHPLMVSKANKRFKESKLSLEAQQMNMMELLFADNSFDFVLSESVLAFTKLSKTLPELFRVMKKDSILLAIEMTKKDSLPSDVQGKLTDFYGLPSILRKDEWESVLQQYGFHGINIQTISLSELEPTEPDIDPSILIPDEMFDMMQAHEELTAESSKHLELSIIRATPAKN
ncbi:class I SAM-dependent methyltransferase [Sutcliffiella rhizosphaerae]|nr:class I SAM-dependent methyltransferase [Sutcliffiella rhizosphaerae]